MTLKCENCDYSFSFCTSEKVNKLHSINLAFVFGMRIIGKGHSAVKKLCFAINIDVPSKRAFGFLGKKLEFAASNVACNTMKEAALEIRSNETDTEFSQCGVSVDGTWQRRGYSSLNGCVSVISIESGKVLDVEFMSKVCRLCNSKNKKLNTIHNYAKHIGSSGATEPLGVYRIFERSVEMRKLQYVNFFGEGDSKGYASVKDIYGKNTVAKYECIGHIQKRVGIKLRKLKSKRKDLGGRGKLTDAFIDKLQNYCGIAIRDNVNNLQGMQRAVIAEFFHCCSKAKQQMHGPVGPDSWRKFQQAVSKDKIYIDKSKGLPPNLINIIKPTYMKLCDQNFLAKCLPGKTQNSNECFNGILWKFIPKDVFVSLTILRLGGYMAVIQFNKGFQGLIDILKHFGVTVGVLTLKGFSELDEIRKTDSKRHSLTVAKVARKK
ncbi:uncharacterized protein TNCV_4722021 [Trichonephila clavipes]|uniref:Mutator-like transposase domain-containing protein n=1 Tax=Trichonephila clavipes TaxID=2585209 RepID=A0A8X7BFW4_TRICX|nr:uncharacterized protein TNCV_4722021 [Trichonephila clavipes]